MEKLHFVCPSCGKKLKVDRGCEGKTVRCPGCKTLFAVLGPHQDGVEHTRQKTSAATQDRTETSTTNYAGFWSRAGACVIDCVLLAVLVMMLRFVVAASDGALSWGFCWLAEVLIYWGYFALLHSSEWQATFGKRALGVFVTDTDGRRLSLARASRRYLVMVAYPFIVGVVAGYRWGLEGWTGHPVEVALLAFWIITGSSFFLVAAFTRKRQAFHDMIVGTLVLKK